MIFLKGGKAVIKMSICERRLNIAKHIMRRKYVTCNELADKFDVSIRTIYRDINFLIRHIPIYTKTGGEGGVYLVSDYKKHSLYLSDKEAKLLVILMERVSQEERAVLSGILIKFRK